MYEINRTHSPSLKSWVVTANQNSDFPIQNLPFGVFRRKKSNEKFRVGVAIGDQIVDLSALNEQNLFSGNVQAIIQKCLTPTLNDFMSLDHKSWSELRHALSDALSYGSPVQSQLTDCLVAQKDVEYSLPASIGDYTDFYTSINHATNIGKLFRPDNPLLPNYQWVPIGYHGRSSSIDVSGQKVHRPSGQLKPPTADSPTVAPCKRLDYELEVGIYIGKGNNLFEPIDIKNAESHVFGLCVFNDWSARDIQGWEYQPLGPFLSKSFASTVSPWIVTLEALAPFRKQWLRQEGHPQPLPYLDSSENREKGSINMSLEVYIETPKMRDNKTAPSLIARSNFQDSYWTISQMIAHHTINGCNLRPGDFFGSGTQSGKTLEEVGSLMESTIGGSKEIELNNGEKRLFLEDGDKVIMSAFCETSGATRIGFGEAVGIILPAKKIA